jgi:hypothetical protein
MMRLLRLSEIDWCDSYAWDGWAFGVWEFPKAASSPVCLASVGGSAAVED